MSDTKPSSKPGYTDDEYFQPIPDEVDSNTRPVNESHCNNLTGNIRPVDQSKTKNDTDSNLDDGYFQPIPDEASDSLPINESRALGQLGHVPAPISDNDDAYFQPIPDEASDSLPINGSRALGQLGHVPAPISDNDDAYFQPIPDDEPTSNISCQSKFSKEHEQKLNASWTTSSKQGQRRLPAAPPTDASRSRLEAKHQLSTFKANTRKQTTGNNGAPPLPTRHSSQSLSSSAPFFALRADFPAKSSSAKEVPPLPARRPTHAPIPSAMRNVVLSRPGGATAEAAPPSPKQRTPATRSKHPLLSFYRTPDNVAGRSTSTSVFSTSASASQTQAFDVDNVSYNVSEISPSADFSASGSNATITNHKH